MKRSASDAGLPPTPQQLRIPAIPVFNQPAIQPPPPPVPLPPTMATVQRPPAAIWPPPHPAFFTFAANQAYPVGSRGLPSAPPAPSHAMRLVSLSPSGNSSSNALPGSTGRYTRGQVAEKTELTVQLPTAADLIELADTLRQPTKLSKITIKTHHPKELKDIFDAIRTSLSVLDVDVYFNGPMPVPAVLNEVFSCFHVEQAPFKSFGWVSTGSGSTSQQIDQFIFEALLKLPLLERIHFSASHAGNAASVNINDADHVMLCVAKHPSLRSLSFKGIDESVFIDAILQGVADSPIIEEVHFDQINLIPNATTLQLAVRNNKQLRSLSIKNCLLEFGSMSQMLKCLQAHPTLESIDFRTAKIPAEELQSIGEPIGALLLTNAQLKSLQFRCTLSPANIAALTVGLAANANLVSLGLDAFNDPGSTETDFSKPDVRHDIDNMFQSSKGLREIVIGLPVSENGTDHRMLKSIVKSPSLEALTIENFLDIGQVSDLLKDNSGIKQLHLKMKYVGIGGHALSKAILTQLIERLKDNKNLLNFSLKLHPEDEEQRRSYGFFDYISKAISSVNEITTRNRIMRMAPLAGIVMSRRQQLLSDVPQALPTLPAELNQLLFETTINYLPPGDAKKLYDTVMPFTPLPGNQ